MIAEKGGRFNAQKFATERGRRDGVMSREQLPSTGVDIGKGFRIATPLAARSSGQGREAYNSVTEGMGLYGTGGSEGRSRIPPRTLVTRALG